MNLRETVESTWRNSSLTDEDTLRSLLGKMAREIDRLREELELTQRRCDRNRDTSSDWMDY